ncbi:J domain-containing protein [Methylomonas methanica]|uniref:Heat shock protein DnaJ domain protein n=1 Tax=Methylomonas methanica (strain DSM 25384 / MC09) TaxID=857087 RepID=G0A0Y0_METMM|nr:DnaJ domain-containing protein [Methylomonas methanica]AEG01236.1 heat shock protein DnaJ domain protein [Methylomonas methanica MC09]
MLEHQTYYDILKVTRDAPTEVIHAAFKALMQLNHPDNFKDREDECIAIAMQLREACDVLITPDTRAQYDKWLEKENQVVNGDCDVQLPVNAKGRMAA